MKTTKKINNIGVRHRSARR